MKLMTLCGYAAAFALYPSLAIAQVAPATAPATSPIILQTQPTALVALAPPTSSAMLRIGTEVPFRLLEEITTKGKQLRVGNRFRLETSEPIIVNGVTVIPTGTPTMSEITDVKNKGMWGKSGKFTARLLYMTVNGRQIRLSGGFDDKGTAGGVGAAAVSAIVFLPAGFFMTGTSAHLPSGTIVKGFIDEDVPLALPAPAPLVVPAPEAAVTVPAPTSETATVAQPAEQ
jgi:hypothetical protein